MVTAIRAVETKYNGYNFRSRKEARWAVFFDTLGIAYEYEKEGFDLDGTWYLPDFWLPEQGCWMEVKGEVPTTEEKRKADMLHIHTSKPVYIFYGDVWIPNDTAGHAIGSSDFCLEGWCDCPGEYMFYRNKRRKLAEEISDKLNVEFIDMDVEDDQDIWDFLWEDEEIPTDVRQYYIDKWYELKTEEYILKANHNILSVFYDLYRFDIKLLLCDDRLILKIPNEVPINWIVQAHKLINTHRDELILALSGHACFEWHLRRATGKHYWYECPTCQKYMIKEDIGGWCVFCAKVPGYENNDNRLNKESAKTPSLIKAYTAARQARFDGRK